jgi:hypothetical protein
LWKTFSALIFTFLLTGAVSYATIKFIRYHITPVVDSAIEPHLMLSLISSRFIIENNSDGLDAVCRYLDENKSLVISSLDDQHKKDELRRNVKYLVQTNNSIRRLLFELKANNEAGKTQYIYVYMPVFEANAQFPRLVFVIDADMIYGDEIAPGYELVTDNMSGFIDVIYSKKVQFIKNNDEFGSHYSIVAPVNELKYSDVYLGVDYDMNGALFSKVDESGYAIMFAMFALVLAIIKLQRHHS